MGCCQCNIEPQSLTIFCLSFAEHANCTQSITKVIVRVLVFREYLQANLILLDGLIIPLQAAQDIRKFVVCIAVA